VFTVCFLSSVVRCQPLSRALVASGKNAAQAESLRLMNCANLLSFVSGCGVLKLRSIFNILALFRRFRH